MRNWLLTLQGHPLAVAGIASALILGTAYGFQFAGYPPCDLCWLQRYPYMAIIALSFAGFFALSARIYKVFVGLIALLFTAVAMLAGFHVGVEQKWWQGPDTCSAGADLSGDVTQALEAILTAPVVRCDEIAWSLFNISMAGYNMIAALLLAVFCITSLMRRP